MAYDIHEALVRLESNLQEVESAKQQVEDTVTSSAELQSIVSSLVVSLEALSQDINLYIASLREYGSRQTTDIEIALSSIKASCNTVISDFQNSLSDCKLSFSQDVSNSIAKLDNGTVKLKTQVEKIGVIGENIKKAVEIITVLQNKLDQISTSLNDSQRGQDQILAAIQETVNSLLPEINSLFSTQSESIETKTTEIKGHLDELSNQCDQINQRIESLENNVKAIQSDISMLKKQCQGISINSWLTIICTLIIIGMILYFR